MNKRVKDFDDEATTLPEDAYFGVDKAGWTRAKKVKRSNVLPYKESAYTLLMTNGTSLTLTEIYNGLGIAITVTNNSAYDWSLTSNLPVFASNKTVLFYNQPNTVDGIFMGINIVNSTVLELVSTAETGDTLVIRVYN